MPKVEMLDEMLEEAVKRIQHDQTSSNITLEMLDNQTQVAKRVKQFTQHVF